MRQDLHELFKTLVRARRDGTFEAAIASLIAEAGDEREKRAFEISSLCGAEVSYSENFTSELVKAIDAGKPAKRVVWKQGFCSEHCMKAGDIPPCQGSCPFNAIIRDKGTNTIRIDEERCTGCGLCVDACPEGQILDKVEYIPATGLVKNGTPVIAAVAPAISGQFGSGATIEKLRTTFKSIGYKEMVEVAFFADMLTLKEAVEFDRFVKKKDDFMITSCCCPMWVAMVKKVYNELIHHVSPSVSPMIAAGRVLKTLHPGCRVVFIGPCVAKKAEAKEPDIAGAIDAVLTFTELKDAFDALGIDPARFEGEEAFEYASRGGRLYARTGGVSTAVGDAIGRLYPAKHELLSAVQGNGVRECKELLSKVRGGEIKANFIEGMGCVGGCVGGPKAILPKEEGRVFVDAYAEASSISVAVESGCMNEILHGLGIDTAEDFQDPAKNSIFERDFASEG